MFLKKIDVDTNKTLFGRYHSWNVKQEKTCSREKRWRKFLRQTVFFKYTDPKFSSPTPLFAAPARQTPPWNVVEKIHTHDRRVQRENIRLFLSLSEGNFVWNWQFRITYLGNIVSRNIKLSRGAELHLNEYYYDIYLFSVHYMRYVRIWSTIISS